MAAVAEDAGPGDDADARRCLEPARLRLRANADPLRCATVGRAPGVAGAGAVTVGTALRRRDPATPVRDTADEAARARREMAARAILARATPLRSRDEPGVPARGSGARHVRLPDWKITKLQAVVDARIEEPLRLGDLARAVGLSVFHFSRALKAATGASPGLWLRQRRVRHAAILLRRTDMPLAEVALACGFSSQSHFTTVFGRIAGTTPAAYRRHTPPDDDGQASCGAERDRRADSAIGRGLKPRGGRQVIGQLFASSAGMDVGSRR